MRITAKMLREKGACFGDVNCFEERWPDGCDITPKNCKIAFGELGMDIDWAAEELLSVQVYIKFNKAETLAWNERNKTRDAAWAKCGGAWCNRPEYRRVMSLAWAEYHKACRATFCELAQQST